MAMAGLGASPSAGEVVIHTPEAVLSRYTETRGGMLYFRPPQGGTWELITHIEDAAIANQGQGAFFPVDPALVRNAVASVTFPLAGVDAEIFILPYPRRALLPSNADRNAIYLSPGVAPLDEQRVHALVNHELGHVVQHQMFPETDADTWGTYCRLRGIEDETIYNERARHRDRPHEIFAEDFRFLFGGRLANYSGGIENPALPLPSTVSGLPAFLLGVAASSGVPDGVLPVLDLQVSPNPATGPVRFALGETADAVFPVRIDVFDVQGRRVSTTVSDPTSQVVWEARGQDGAPLPAGLYFVRAVQRRQAWTGKLLIAR
jgi:hypothetical protein